MKFLFLSLFLLAALPLVAHPLDRRELSSDLRELLRVGGIQEPYTWDRVVAETQRHWIAVRQGEGGKERCDLCDTLQQLIVRPQLIKIMERMGFFKVALPHRQNYRYAVCLGGLLPGVRARLYQLVEAWNSGIRFDTLVFLSGERPLRKGVGAKDDLADLLDPIQSPLPFRSGWQLPSDSPYEMENDMVKLVYDQVQLPPDMAKIEVLFINAPRGKAQRPTTRDTYVHWMQEASPKPGAVLASSSPLLCYYQQLVGKRILGPRYLLDTIAPAANPAHLPVSFLLDTVAKCLYELHADQ